MHVSDELNLPTGIWRHNKTGRRYQLLGVARLMLEGDKRRTMLRIGGARFSEASGQPMLVWLATGEISPGGQWLIDTLQVPLKDVGPVDPLVIYIDLQNPFSDEPHLWVRPMFGHAGWLTSPDSIQGKRRERFTFEMAAAPWPL